MSKSSKKKTKKNFDKGKKFLFQTPKGMHDILPGEQPWWEKLRKASQETANFYNFSRIDTPILESVELFERGTGMTTDIVEKEMFTLRTRGGDKLALRPENTPGIVRAYFEHGLSRLPQPLKIFYFGPFFRYQQPQFGRFRQFHQIGFEILGGEDDPIYDSQAILVGFRFLEELKIKKPSVQINSLGCKNCRAAFRRKLTDYYKKLTNKICKDCRRRLTLNPLRLLDCKNEDCEKLKAKAPVALDCLCSSCRSHFRETLEYLDELKLPYTLNTHLVRGLDYYNRTVFELFSEGFNIALGGGGRYDYLAEMLGGRKSGLAAVGCALGAEAIIEVMKAQGLPGILRPRAKVFFIQIGKPAKKRGLSLIEEFYKSGIKVIESLGKESLKSQLKAADKEECEMALILGQCEVFEESIIIRDMKSGVQETVPMAKVVDEIKRRIK